MTLFVLNARGICSSERQNELKKICDERAIEIFGILETKTKNDRFKEAIERLGPEWKMEKNSVDEDRDSIWLGWKGN